MRSKIKVGDLEVGAIVEYNKVLCRVVDVSPVLGGRYFRRIGVMQLLPDGELETAFRIHANAEIEGHNRIDRLQLGRRYRLRDRVNFAEWIGDCLAVYGETNTYVSYSILQVGTPLVATHDTADIAVGEPEVLEDISPSPGEQVRIISQSVEGAIVRQLPDGRWLVDCGDGVGEFEADIFDLEY